MLTDDFIIDLFCRVDDLMLDQPKHTQAKLFPSEIVTLFATHQDWHRCFLATPTFFGVADTYGTLANSPRAGGP